MLMTFYNGVELKLWSPHKVWHSLDQQKSQTAPQNKDLGRQVVGVVCALGSGSSYSLWLIIQVSGK